MQSYCNTCGVWRLPAAGSQRCACCGTRFPTLPGATASTSVHASALLRGASAGAGRRVTAAADDAPTASLVDDTDDVDEEAGGAVARRDEDGGASDGGGSTGDDNDDDPSKPKPIQIQMYEPTPETVRLGVRIALIAPSGSGKTVFMVYLMHAYASKVDVVIGLAGSVGAARDMAQFIPHNNIWQTWDADFITKLTAFQHNNNAQKRAQRVMILMDDLGSALGPDGKSANAFYQPVLEVLFTKGRHDEFTLLIALQNWRQFPPKLRGNTNVIIPLRIDSKRDIKELYDQYVSTTFDTVKDFQEALRQCTQRRGAMIIDLVAEQEGRGRGIFAARAPFDALYQPKGCVPDQPELRIPWPFKVGRHIYYRMTQHAQRHADASQAAAAGTFVPLERTAELLGSKFAEAHALVRAPPAPPTMSAEEGGSAAAAGRKRARGDATTPASVGGAPAKRTRLLGGGGGGRAAARSKQRAPAFVIVPAPTPSRRAAAAAGVERRPPITAAASSTPWTVAAASEVDASTAVGGGGRDDATTALLEEDGTTACHDDDEYEDDGAEEATEA